MKKYVYLLAAAAALITMSSCSNAGSPAGKTDNTAQAVTELTDEPGSDDGGMGFLDFFTAGTISAEDIVSALRNSEDSAAQTAPVTEAPETTTSVTALETETEPEHTDAAAETTADTDEPTSEWLESVLDKSDEEVPQVHLPAQAAYIPEEELLTGTEADPEYTEDRAAGNKVFIVSVDPDATDAMMQEVIDKYGLEIIYDYESFSMYALAVPEPLDADATRSFIDELESTYDFILMVEPDSVVYLDSGAEVQ